MVFGTYYIINYNPGTTKYFGKYNRHIKNELNLLIAEQRKSDALIKEAADSKKYTLDNPYILNNPYQISPLSSVIVFETKDKESVSVYINDEHVTDVEASKTHIIPVYGLFSSANNIVKLVTSSGNEKEIEITVSSFNDSTDNLDFKDLYQDKTHYFLVGDTTKITSNMRGFDKNLNMLFYLDLDYINSLVWKKDNRFYIGYNSILDTDKVLNNDLMLEMDFLGKIYSISVNNSSLLYSNNITSNKESYIGSARNLYQDKISNHQPISLVDADFSTTKPIIIETTTLEEKLDNAPLYEKNYTLALNYKKIDFSLKDKYREVNLLLVSKNNAYTYQYNIKNKTHETTSIITDLEGEYSLYLEIDGNYYSLITTIEN